MIRRLVLTWVLMIPVAILNGGFRQSVVVPVVGDLRGHQVSVVTGSAAFLALTWLMLHRQLPALSDRQALGAGAAWTSATILFEFGFGHWVMDHSWEYLFADYNVLEGRLWPVVLLIVLLAPWLVKHIELRREEQVHPIAGAAPAHH